ncbi:hypothetical protein AKJ16_DCAP04969 [Drosera capensis]
MYILNSIFSPLARERFIFSSKEYGRTPLPNTNHSSNSTTPPRHSRRSWPEFSTLLRRRIPTLTLPSSRRLLVKASTGIESTSAPEFKPPTPMPFTVRPDRGLDILGASLALIFMLGTELTVFEGCSWLVAAIEGFGLVMPRKKYSQVDRNTGVAMYESDDIINYLVNKRWESPTIVIAGVANGFFQFLYYSPCIYLYFCPMLHKLIASFRLIYCGLDLNRRLCDAGKNGQGKLPGFFCIHAFDLVLQGGSYTPAKLPPPPPKPLELWAYKPSPFSKVVREGLVEFELPHILYGCARGSPKRQELYERVGHFQVPYFGGSKYWSENVRKCGYRRLSESNLCHLKQVLYACMFL